MDSIKRNVSLDKMALYDPERIRLPIELFLSKDDPQLDDLDPFHMHYYGKDAVDEMAKDLSLKPGDTVLDLGAGFCATSCILAKKFGCHVTAVELQEIQAMAGQKIVEKMGLTTKVQVVSHDFFDLSFGKKFDYVITLFAVTHIPDRVALFSKIYENLQPNGTFYVQDFYRNREITPKEDMALKEIVATSYLPGESDFCRQLESVGFNNISFCDVTDQWTDFVQTRFDANQKCLTGSKLSTFYRTVKDLFVSGCLRGAIVKAIK